MTEQLPFHFKLSCIGEGNGNPLQCSCLENPRDGGAWRAAVYGVAQSRTRLKRLTSSSSKKKRQRNQKSNCQYLLDHQKSKRVPEKHLLLLLLPSRPSGVQLCATPQMTAHQAPPSLGFSRQEHWSGLPFPFPVHESEK